MLAFQNVQILFIHKLFFHLDSYIFLLLKFKPPKIECFQFLYFLLLGICFSPLITSLKPHSLMNQQLLIPESFAIFIVLISFTFQECLSFYPSSPACKSLFPHFPLHFYILVSLFFHIFN